ncbi:MAG: T9SS type A sorting domain-containing protein, partial [Pedobacter sp.]|nr:T9SS type A sorting domain-containing protein [Chitinophagaceae bacterium]
NATVVSNSNATSFYTANLSISTQYYFYVFSKNSICTNGPKYLATSPLIGNATTTATAALNYYFGNLHAHTYYSDGGKDNSSTIPSTAYAYAKNSLCMDYLGISEHNHATAGMNVANWQPGIDQAAAATTSNFLALYGMEWGVISNGGHVLVYGVNQLLGWEDGNYNKYVPKSDYLSTAGLFRTVNSFGGNAFASLAHPSFTDYGNIANSSLNATADSAIAGAAVSSGPAFSTSTTYSDPATSLGYYEYFKTLLAKGYHIGPLMDHDNHNTTFGRTSNVRTVFIAPSLSQTEFLKAMKARHFYATEDCDTRVNFLLNNQLMGSIFAGVSLPSISINVTDPTNTSAIAKIKIMYGKPGSGINAVAIDSINANTFNFTDYNVINGTTGYYFAEITIAGNRVISAPIWYTYNTALPVSLLSFTAAINNNKTTSVSWVTSAEINNKLFVIERSIDGIHFSAIDSVAGRGNSSLQNNYAIVDANPVDGINYYRLKQIDNDGKTTYSNVVSVNLNKALINYFTIYPNPVNSQLTVNINSKTEQTAKLIITDVFGRTLQTAKLQLSKGNQLQTVAINQLVTGTYNVTIMFNDTQLTKKVVKL